MFDVLTCSFSHSPKATLVAAFAGMQGGAAADPKQKAQEEIRSREERRVAFFLAVRTARGTPLLSHRHEMDPEHRGGSPDPTAPRTSGPPDHLPPT